MIKLNTDYFEMNADCKLKLKLMAISLKVKATNIVV